MAKAFTDAELQAIPSSDARNEHMRLDRLPPPPPYSDTWALESPMAYQLPPPSYVSTKYVYYIYALCVS